MASISVLVKPSSAPFKYTFSRPVSSGLKPTPSSMKGTSFPLMVTFPRSGTYMPEIILSNVDLPEPFRPTIPKKSPWRTSKLISFKTVCSVYPLMPFVQLMKACFKPLACSVGRRNDLETCSTDKTTGRSLSDLSIMELVITLPRQTYGCTYEKQRFPQRAGAGSGYTVLQQSMDWKSLSKWLERNLGRPNYAVYP